LPAAKPTNWLFSNRPVALIQKKQLPILTLGMHKIKLKQVKLSDNCFESGLAVEVGML